MSYKLITPPSSEPVTLDEARLHLRVDITDDNSYITSLITVARMAAEEKTGRSLMLQTWEYADDDFDEEIILAHPPIASVDTFTYIDYAGNQASVSQADYVLNDYKHPPRLQPAYLKSWPIARDQSNSVKVRYTTGYESAGAVPAPIKQWMLLAIGDMYAQRERSAEKPIIPQGFADGLLEPYKVYGV